VWRRRASRPDLTIIGEVAVWRAANGIHPNDPRPTGPTAADNFGPLGHDLNRTLARGGDDNIGF